MPPVELMVKQRTSGVTRKSSKMELITGFEFLNPLQLLGCSLQKKYQPIHLIKNLIHFHFSQNPDVIAPQVSPAH